MLKETLFLILVFFIVFSAIALVFARRTIYSIFSLIALYLFISVLINYTLEMEFISLLYILIYIGAVAILFLFIVMMVPLKDEVDYTKTVKSTFTFSNFQIILLISVFAVLFLNPLWDTFYNYLIGIWTEFDAGTNNFMISSDTEVTINSSAFLKDIYLFGFLLYSVYSFHLILVAYFLFVILVAVMWLTQE